MKLLTMPNRSSAPLPALAPGRIAQIWATEGNLATAVAYMHPALPEVSAAEATHPTSATRSPLRVVITPETAFYRKYTEAMLRRYGVMALQKGRVPSLLGRELFRGKVTSYRVQSFEDVIIFVTDVERCLKLLDAEQQKLIVRVAVQEYTLQETATMLRWSLRSTERRYHEALDELTAIFQKRKLMEKTPGLPPRKSCQEGNSSSVSLTYSESAS